VSDGDDGVGAAVYDSHIQTNVLEHKLDHSSEVETSVGEQEKSSSVSSLPSVGELFKTFKCMKAFKYWNT